jgi:O-antigen ligase
MSAALSFANPRTTPRIRYEAARLSYLERAFLALGIWEIPLQLDKYLMFRQSDSELGAVAGFNISLTTFSLIVLYALWFFQSAVEHARIKHRVIPGIPMLIYIFFVALSALVAEVPILAAFDLFLLLQAYGLFFYLANRVRARTDVLFCLFILVTTLLTQSVLVFGLAALGERGYGQRYDFGPMSLSVWEEGRVAGTLLSAVVCGSVMAFLWLPVMALTLTIQSKHAWWLATITTVVGLVAVALTQTRGAILSIVIGSLMVFAAMLWRKWLPRWTGYAALAVVLLSSWPVAHVVRNRVLGDDNHSAESRKHLSLIALQMLRDQPIFGYGAGNCHLAAQKYADQGIFRAEWYYTIHSKYLLAWVETGIFGLASFGLLLGNALRYGLRAWNSRDRELAPIGLAIMAGLTGSMVHMAVDIFNSRVQVQILWAVMGVVAAVYRITRLKGQPCSPWEARSDVA